MAKSGASVNAMGLKTAMPIKPGSVAIEKSPAPKIPPKPVQQPSTDPKSKIDTTDIVMRMPPQQTIRVETLFPKDPGRLNNAYKPRETRMVAAYTKIPPSPLQIDSTKRRLMMWEPYWEIIEILSICVTASLATPRMDHNRAIDCEFQVSQSAFNLTKDWGKPLDTTSRMNHQKKYKNGQVRLLVRMLPSTEPPTGNDTAVAGPKSKYKKRADTHLWPKGTFLQVDGTGQQLAQRKQQTHDLNEWKGMCYPHDMTPSVKSTQQKSALSILTMDNTPYILCVSVCRYRDSMTLYSAVQPPNIIETMSKEDGKAYAQEMTKKNLLVLDGASDDDENKSNSKRNSDTDDIRSIVFQLTCSMSYSLMKTPVRSFRCPHFQCFDLQNFLESNQHVTGTRWECPVCNKLIVSVFELLHCEFTSSLLKQYEKEATSTRNRVEVFSDGRYRLRPEQKKRYGARSAANSTPSSAMNGVTSQKNNGKKKATTARTDPVTSMSNNPGPPSKKARKQAQIEIIDLL